MRTVRLYGELGRRFGRVWRFDVRTPAEAVRALCSQVAGFRQYLHANRASGYRVLCDTEARDEQSMALGTAARTIRIVPVVQGAGKGLGQIVLGAALIAFAWWNPLGWSATGFLSTATISSIGTSLVLGGIAQALTKSPSTSTESVERPENRPSYAFDGAVNTAAQGNPVPVCYGELIVGSQVVSAGLVTEQIAA